MHYHNHFSVDIDKSLALATNYDAFIVVISYLIAIIAGYCAFNIINILKIDKKRPLFLKILAGMILGLGIWSMHFIGMLAFSLPIPIYYDVDITLISVIPAMIACILFVQHLSHPTLSKKSIIFASLALTLGVTTMHFIGMFAMSMKANMVHDTLLLIVVAVVSLISSTFTVLIATNRLLTLTRNIRIISSTVLFGFTTANMHYLAMETSYFLPNDSINPTGIANDLLSYGVVAIAVILMVISTLIVNLQKKISTLTELTSEQNKLLKDTIDNMQDGFVLTDDDGSILMANKKFTENFSSNSSAFDSSNGNINSLYNKLFYELFLTEQQTINKISSKISSSKQNDSYKVATNKEEFWLLRRHKTSSKHVIQTWTDITEQTKQEEALILEKNKAYDTLSQLKNTQTELLETKKMASLGRLVSGIAHEMNTPIGICITALTKIKEDTEKTQLELAAGTMKKSTFDTYFNHVIQLENLTINNLKKAAELINKFKHISVAEESDKLTSFNLSHSLQNLLSTWQKDNNVEINLLISDSIELNTYENTLAQVITSFVNNSIEHAFSDSQPGLITISAKSDENQVEITFTDNGCGIDNSIIDNIFEPFITTKRNEGKVGLGIHIVYNLVYQKLLGTLKMNKRTDESSGTEFIISIPVDMQNTDN